MRPRGLIYKDGRPLHGVTILGLPKVTRFGYHFVRAIGSGFIGFFVIGLIFTFGPLAREEINFSLNKSEDNKKQVEAELVKFAQAESTIMVQKEADLWGVSSHFSVVIPEINATSNVIANVDVGDKEAYFEALKSGVAHAKGTYFPGQGKSVFLFSHSTDSPLNIARYNAVFYLLRKLEKGNKIIVFFADQKYEYEVVDKVVTQPSDTSWLTVTENSETLILMTCDPPGTTWRRLLVVARPISK